jgi:hypothetical protein
MNVKYCAPCRDYSGYGEASRHDLKSLVDAGVEVTTQIPHFCLEIADFEGLGKLASDLEKRPIDYKVKILHLTPNVFGGYIEPNKYHVGRVFWETDKLPADFANGCKHLDEIWTGSEANKQAILNAGVDKPIYIVPEAIDTSNDIDKIQPLIIDYKDDFKFYSVFEWSERKNPTALLTAFWLEFEKDVNVSLTIKSYSDNFTPNQQSKVESAIKDVKYKLLNAVDRFAPVYLYDRLLDRSQMYRFHKTFDCFVSTHRGEGWGIPQMEALYMKNHLISTGCGGIHEYLDSGDGWVLPYTMIPLAMNTQNPQWYTQDQKWADVDIKEVRKAMREAYENCKGLKNEKGHTTVVSKFSTNVVGEIMRKRLEEIYTKLN